MDKLINKLELALTDYLTPKNSELFGKIYEIMKYSVLGGGKRIRSILTIRFCELCGGNIDNVIPFACAVEMIHAYSLIHDDLPCMDNDDIRRGKSSNHIVFGEDMALLAGDGLLTKAFEIMFSNAEVIGYETAAKAAAVMASCAGADGMVGGQCIDLQSEGKKISIKELEAMNMGKTVSLIKAACIMGVIVGGGNGEYIKAAEEFAIGIGMAFQIRDDILDVIGNANILGKSTGADAENEKCNYVSILGVEKASELVNEYTDRALMALKIFSGNTDILSKFTLSLVEREK